MITERQFKVLVLIVLTLCLALVMADGAELNRPALLGSIVMVENTPGRGRNGELGPYQFTRAVWRQHSTMEFTLANARSVEAERVALAHLHWLEQHVDKPTPYRLALAWNAGLGAVQRNTFRDSSVDYAKRVLNVYEEATKP